jgi:hypothetical protein
VEDNPDLPMTRSQLGMEMEEIRQFLRERDGDFCFTGQHKWRPTDEVTVEHWIPLVHGGSWALDNLRLACKRCNSEKADRIPNPDGTLPPHPKDLLPVHQRRADKSGRVEPCETCYSGRLLLEGEECDVCGSGPQPSTAPAYKQRAPKDCDHDVYTCWMCFIGHVPRKPASEDALVNER